MAREMFRHACQMGAEGIVSKLATSTWRGDRSRQWLKSKCVHPTGIRRRRIYAALERQHGIGSLLLGYYKAGELIYAGRTGTGFNQKTHKMLRDRLERSARQSPRSRACPQKQRRMRSG